MPILFLNRPTGCSQAYTWRWGLDSTYHPFIAETFSNTKCVMPVSLKLNSWSHISFSLTSLGEVTFWLNGRSTAPCMMAYFQEDGFTVTTVGRGATPVGTALYDRLWGPQPDINKRQGDTHGGDDRKYKIQ